MQDCMNREQMELASASTSAAVPAATRRGPVAALIAAVIAAAACGSVIVRNAFSCVRFE